jgi:hypothetical protein
MREHASYVPPSATFTDIGSPFVASARLHTCPMRVPWRVVTVIALLASVLVGCSPSAPTVAVAYEPFQFTCCANAGALIHTWHPGQVITLQWSAVSAGMTPTDTRHSITLMATFTGPYATVAALKAGGTHRSALVASSVGVTDRTSDGAVSTISLPFDMATGLYNLATISKSAGGSTGGATVIQVTR